MAAFSCRAKNIAQGKMAGTKMAAEQLGLGSLAHAWGSQQDKTPGTRLIGARIRTNCIATMKPGGMVIFRIHISENDSFFIPPLHKDWR